MRRAALFTAILLVASGCAPHHRPRAEGVASTTVSTTTTTTATTTTTTTTAAAPAVAATASCPAIPARATPRADRTRYALTVDVRPADGLVVGTTTAHFTPDLDTDHLVFRLWANGPREAAAGSHIEVTGVSNGSASQPNATTLLVNLSRPLPAGTAVDETVSWRLVVPGPVNDRVSRSGDAIRLGSFFPVLPWEPGRGWATEPPTAGFAEASTAPAADVDASITVPAGFDVLATGVPDGNGHWSAPAVPDFAISVGHFRMASTTIAVPQPVKVTVGVHDLLTDDPARYLARITESIIDYSRRFGPYPWPAFTMAVEPALRGGIEYPMHVMQGPGSIGRTTPHEVAHQWFYALVENNQGRDPWLDEGLASWAEARHEGTLDSFVRRVIPLGAKGHLADPMTYWESRRSVYYAGVYAQGAQALAALGPPDQVDCALRLYVARKAYQIARPADLVAAASLVFPNAAETLARFGVHA